ncbi:MULTISPECIES: hypothetical protein [Arthrobacter]|uniref:DUF4145 domain-containing protein n=1 Tax=Arthrobacter sunyaminii TaxID=2816859 RepID=A0A975S8B3_9MICC|nr:MULTISPECIES: hypothetical protein [Arthrobacter]MBO0895253.1 hypothetical protein [Arthrobacter sunyaminii]MBO0906928.1 hypothetical protein [Arthrobacter sunyaminii]QWQ37680.1 hypothetical protein KG104_08215 [Arthrobacter sunyaminii]
MTAEWLVFITSLVSLLAWPAAVVVLLFLYKKPVISLVLALSERIAELKEVSSPLGGVKFFREQVEETIVTLTEGAAEASSAERSIRASASTSTGGSREETPKLVRRADRDNPESHGSDIRRGLAHRSDSAASGLADRRPIAYAEMAANWIDAIERMKQADASVATLRAGTSKWATWVNRLQDIADLVSPAAAVKEAYSEVEYAAQGWVKLKEPEASLKGHDLIRALRNSDTPRYIADSVDQLRLLRNFLAHNGEFISPSMDIREYASIAWTLIEGFQSLQQE